MRLIRPFLVSLTALAVACGGGGGDGGGVTNPPPTNTTLDHITVTPATLALVAGQTETISASGQAADNSGVSTTFSYSSSAQAVASVSNAGKVLGISAGTTTITVTGTAGSVTKSATVAVTISGTLPNAVNVVAGAETNDFTPREVAIQRGGVVTWTFPGTTHNVDFGGTAGAPANIGNTGNSNTGISRSFANAGSFAYVCSLHSGMGGSVLVP